MQRLLALLPCQSTINTWGEEVYFSLPLNVALEPGAQQVVPPGTVCFWVEGSALALPWGRTPLSHGDECRLVSPCNVLGRLRDDPAALKTARDGDPVSLEILAA